ncbi:MAG TPA: hypothetical protein DDW85_06010 [Porphyromonadaceae bacterium]|nr:hypothetical protein [Porphyromonadaceae bacterium]
MGGEIGKMAEAEKQANIIIVAAYKNGGKVYYKDVKHLITENIDSVNSVLKRYGKLYALLTDGSWNSFEIDYSGMKLRREKIPDIFKKKKRGFWSYTWRGIFIGVSVYFVIQLILWIAGRIGS